eukprot:scaffold108846_cov54-Phaeocystis_antarctica.AAC.1
MRVGAARPTLRGSIRPHPLKFGEETRVIRQALYPCFLGVLYPRCDCFGGNAEQLARNYGTEHSFCMTAWRPHGMSSPRRLVVGVSNTGHFCYFVAGVLKHTVTPYMASAWRRHQAALPARCAFPAGAECSAAARS